MRRILRHTATAVVIALSLTACSDSDPRPRDSASPQPELLPVAMPTVSSPPDIGSTALISTFFDLGSVGYVQEEFFLSGTATSFSNRSELGRDGRWEMEPVEQADYVTRVVVYRPADSANFSGTAVVEWLNVTQGFDVPVGWGAGHVEALRRGHAWVSVTAQLVGIEGLEDAALPLALKVADPERYAELSHPGDSFSYDIFTQASAAVRDSSADSILGGVGADVLIAAGESQSAARLLTYVNAVHPLYEAYDGFLVDSRFNSSADLSQAPEADIPAPEAVTFRDDLTTPVINFQGETDVIGLGSIDERQPDSEFFRLWEVAGIAHNDNYQLVAGRLDIGEGAEFAMVVENNSILGAFICEKPINSGAYAWVYMAALRNLELWIRDGTPAPEAARIAALDDNSAFQFDDVGNVLGGVRSPYVDAPPARMSGEANTGGPGCGLSGTTTLFDAATMAMLYTDRQGYIDAVNAATDEAVAARFLLEEDAVRIRAAAGLQWDALGN